MKHDGVEITGDDVYEVAVSGIIAKGGDHFTTFTETIFLREYAPLGDLTIEYFKKYGTVPTPTAGRQTDIAQ